jgi:fumarate hydratase class II
VFYLEKRCIAAVCDEILAGKLEDEFPLVIWQTGSGTKSNMNVNEVVANRAQVLKGFAIGEGGSLKPMMMSTSHNHQTIHSLLECTLLLTKQWITIPGVEKLRDTLHAKLPNSKRSKNRSYPPYGCDTTSWSRAFWLCGTVKLWFEGGKTIAHLSE